MEGLLLMPVVYSVHISDIDVRVRERCGGGGAGVDGVGADCGAGCCVGELGCCGTV